jgi:hypothetical protein
VRKTCGQSVGALSRSEYGIVAVQTFVHYKDLIPVDLVNTDDGSPVHPAHSAQRASVGGSLRVLEGTVAVSDTRHDGR